MSSLIYWLPTNNLWYKKNWAKYGLLDVSLENDVDR